MRYFISYSEIVEGGLHGHTEIKNTFRDINEPLTEEKIRELEEKHLSHYGNRVSIINFIRMDGNQ